MRPTLRNIAHPLPRLAPLALLALLVLARGAVAQQSAPPDYDRWYAIEIRGQKAGHAHMVQQTAEDGRVTTSSTMQFEISRSRMTATMEMVTAFVESPGGELERVEFSQSLGTGTTVESTYRFEDGAIAKVSKHMGQETRSRRDPFDMEYLTPVEVREHLVGRIDAGAEEIKYVSVDPTSGLKLTQTVSRVHGPEKIRVYGREMVALKVTSVNSATPSVEVTEYLDEQGVALKTDMKMGAFPFRLTAMTKEEALREGGEGGGDGDGPELFTTTFVRVDPPVDSPRDVIAATFRLEVEQGELPGFFSGGAHAFERLSETTGRVRVDLDNPASAPGKTLSDPRYTRPTTYANTEDTRIIRLAQTAVKGAPADDPMARADAAREFVYGFVESKDLGTGFATASEVCRTARGDCSEHAVLLAALLRAQRIPSRVISGLVYADAFAGRQSVFVYHMWTQALMTIDGKPRWIDLDATLPPGKRMDAMHIAVSSFDLTEGELTASMTPVVSLLGNLSVGVESISRD